ncbi:hypothetical protein [Trichlorobacter sp.]|uniref:Nmad2 family putative nucleotide modification protein n=1 Tax=Trichlorobacter sp. TaxID=2911007 RepID=UPI002A36428C|nr:hypothetical protein [Trichlorobacter sp.]MDY0383873.1 hypothetical protein [Trichlorobacter sp.]
MKLISYKMSDDSGFAPNPFFGVLTLATCKAGIRRSSTRKEGDWIAGFGSKSMCGDEVGNERLIFLMEVKEKIPLENYYKSYPPKRPIPRGNSTHVAGTIKNVRRGCCGSRQEDSNSVADLRKDRGDNIYRFVGNTYEVLPNRFHPAEKPEHKVRDISGRYVLISTNFYYFGGGYEADGRTGYFLPEAIQRPNLVPGQSGYGTITEGSEIPLIKYIQERFKKNGIYGRPFRWPPNNESWKKDENYIQP